MAISASRVSRALPFGVTIIPLLIARPSLDNVFDMVQLPIGGASVGPGFLFNIFMVLAAVTLTVHALLVNRVQQRAVLTAAGIWGPFLLATVVAASYSPALVEAIQTLFNFLTYSAVTFLGIIYGAKLSRSALTVIVALSGVVPVFFGLGQAALGLAGPRLSSTFSHPNIFAFFCLLYISFLFHAQLSGYIRKQAGVAAIWGLIGGAMITLLLTGTRSAYLSTFLFLLCYSGLRKPVLVLPLLLLPPLALLVPAVSDRIIDAISGSTPVSYDYFVSAMRGDVADSGVLALDSGTWRRYLWQAAWPWIEQRPILGHGIGSFRILSQEFFPLSAGHGSGAHNVYVQLLFEGGALFLTSYIWVFVSISYFLVVRHNKDKFDSLCGILLMAAFAVASLSDNMLNYLSINIMIWFMVAVTAGYRFPVNNDGQVVSALLSYRFSARPTESRLRGASRPVLEAPEMSEVDGR